MPLTYFFLLPQNTAFLSSSTLANYEEQTNPSQVIPYTPLATTEEGDEGEEEMLPPKPEKKFALSLDDKLRLVKPLLLKYMLPLCESSFFLLIVTLLTCFLSSPY